VGCGARAQHPTTGRPRVTRRPCVCQAAGSRPTGRLARRRTAARSALRPGFCLSGPVHAAASVESASRGAASNIGTRLSEASLARGPAELGDGARDELRRAHHPHLQRLGRAANDDGGARLRGPSTGLRGWAAPGVWTVTAGIEDYGEFVAPGITSLTALTGAVAGGATLLEERRRGFMETGVFYPLGALEPVQSKARIIPTSSVGRWASVARVWL
jgi:hypothetical protein